MATLLMRRWYLPEVRFAAVGGGLLAHPLLSLTAVTAGAV
jgi:hypothetical protein